MVHRLVLEVSPLGNLLVDSGAVCVKNGSPEHVVEKYLLDGDLIGTENVVNDDIARVFLAQNKKHHFRSRFLSRTRFGHFESPTTITSLVFPFSTNEYLETYRY